jgi:hypothetical protein
MTDDVLFGYRLQLFDLSGRTSVATRSGLRSSNESARPRPECNRPATAPVAQAGPMNRPRARRGRPPRPTRVGILALTLALVIPLAVIASGCGGSSAGTGSSGGSKREALVAFSACMRKHGVANFPDPTASGSGTKLSLEGIDTNAPTFKSAQQACRRLLPGTPTKQEQAARLGQALDYAGCMRKHGVPKFPNPKLSSGGGIEWGELGPRVGADPNSPRFKAAEDACRKLAPR